MIAAKESEPSISQLRELGFDPEASPADAVAKLASLRASANPAAIAHALGQITTPEAAAVLVEMEVGATGGLRREIRRALFRLRQRGIESALSAQAGTNVARPPEGDSGFTGMMSVSDADGARIVWLMKSRPGGGLKRLWALISDKGGLVAVNAESLSRKELRTDRAELEERAGAPMVETDWHLADFIMYEAYRRTPEQGKASVGNYLSLRTEMLPFAPPTDFHHPVYDQFADAAASDPPADLMKEPDIAAYRLPPEAVKPFADETAQLQQSTLVLNRMLQEDRVNTVIERAIEQLLGGDHGDRLRRRLEDTAYYFAGTGKRVQAGWAAAAAAKLRDRVELARIPFFQAFMRAQLGAVLTEQEGKRQEEPRLIMTPAEMMRARAAAQARMARRGALR